jgi:nitrogen fixation NifU-like protein
MTALPAPLDAHFRAPHGAGQAFPGAARGAAENSACGDHLVLWLDVTEQRVERAAFQARGCSASIAVASLVCSRVEGLELLACAAAWPVWRAELAPSLPKARQHALELAGRALLAALAEARERCHPGQIQPSE